MFEATGLGHAGDNRQAAANMKLHWGPNSPFVRKVMITAHETGLADRITLVRSPVAMNKANAEVMADNPLSKIPTLVTDEGRVLFGSDVVCEYLDSLHEGARLIPPVGDAHWDVLYWNALGSGMLDALVLWRNERMRPEAHQSIETLHAYEQKSGATLERVEKEIAALEDLPFSLGHIAIGCMFGYFDLRFADVDWRHGRPACTRWFDAFKTRPSVQCTEPSVADKLVPPTPSMQTAGQPATHK
ncbi:glutathione S-transferase family protein [Paraburkholderia phenoliruptrix]|uniref:glutathione S-transferase family protein n=1 Tax=Paraburkholderia phenoliruptrix TaxID=252970 RepID=UPI002862213D|nr:glutathione S-transferase [Paraburkholderia phenoliruptrix]MDR6391461.1 glutathione S-transferase [Paraburkholderia phenoliruptrix]WMY11717.1 glutathione S-transferase [Paraburkholderia phenoliruptrix]